MLKAILKYTQTCNMPLETSLADFQVFVNKQLAHEAKIRCITTEDEIELNPSLFKGGNNELEFKISEGDFSFNLMKVETQSREGQRPTYYFTVTSSQYEDIKSGERGVMLEMLLEQSNKLKNARLLINNNELVMQTDRSIYEKDLKDFVVEGTNFIKIIPSNSFVIVGLKVNLE